MHSYTEENYLKALFNLANGKGEVSVNDLSKNLAIKMPTVNSMMKKLAEKKLVYYESYKPLRLTEKGKKVAGLIIRKHRLTEMFLVQIMDFGWENATLNLACRLEYVDWNKGEFTGTGGNIADDLWSIMPAISFRPSAQTVLRLNYRHQQQQDLLGNPPAKTGGFSFGFSTYF